MILAPSPSAWWRVFSAEKRRLSPLFRRGSYKSTSSPVVHCFCFRAILCHATALRAKPRGAVFQSVPRGTKSSPSQESWRECRESLLSFSHLLGKFGKEKSISSRKEKFAKKSFSFLKNAMLLMMAACFLYRVLSLFL